MSLIIFFRPETQLIPIYFVSLPSVRGEIRTDKEASAIISRIAKSVGNCLEIKDRTEIISG